MKVNEYRSMSVGEVQQHLAERQQELSNLRFQLVTKQLASPVSVRHIRREVSRLRTVLREHELGLHVLTTPHATEQASSGGGQEVKES